MGLGLAFERRNRQQPVAFKIPQAGTIDLIDIAGAAGDQLGGFLQRIVLAVAMTGEAQDQVLLGTHALQMLKLIRLGTLVERQGDLQAAVLCFKFGHRGGRRAGSAVFNGQQIAAQKMSIVLFVGLAQLHQVQWAQGGVQGVMHNVVVAGPELMLDCIVQVIAGAGFHQTGVGRANQRAQVCRGHAELALAVRVEIEHGPAGFIKPFETQHAEPGRYGELGHDLGCQARGSIRLAFHWGTRFTNADCARAVTLSLW